MSPSMRPVPGGCSSLAARFGEDPVGRRKRTRRRERARSGVSGVFEPARAVQHGVPERGDCRARPPGHAPVSRPLAPRIEKRSDGLVAALKEWTSATRGSRTSGTPPSAGCARPWNRAGRRASPTAPSPRSCGSTSGAGPANGRPASTSPADPNRAVRAAGRRSPPRARRRPPPADGSRPRRPLPVPDAPQSTETAEGIRGVEVLATTKAADSRIIVLRRRALDASEFSEDLPRVDRSPDSIVGPLDAALRLIARHSPAYLAWIRRVVRQVLPQADDPAMITSSSAAWRPGVLYSANRPDPAALVEMLIHEATHQYMYILRQLGPLDDGSDDALPLARPRNDEAPRRDGRRVPRGRRRHALLPGLPRPAALRPRERSGRSPRRCRPTRRCSARAGR